MGLLDNFANAPAESGFNDALLAAAQALLTPRARGGGMGAAFGAFPDAMNRAQQRQMQNRLFGLKERALDAEMSEAERKRLAAETAAANRTAFFRQLAERGQFKPDMLPAAMQAGIDPKEIELMAKGSRLGLPNLVNVNGVGVDPQTWQPVGAVADPNKPFSTAIGQDGQLRTTPNREYQGYELAKAATGAARTDIRIDQGQKGFDNTQGLRKEFQGLPEYKAFKEMQTTSDIIVGALKNPSPANDMAAATKFMKMLDPGSVVRESELGMAMSATGMLDRVMNIAQQVINGYKLTPKQRQDFYGATQQIMSAAAGRYNSLVGQYRKEAGKWGLDADSVATEAPVTPTIDDLLKKYGQ